MINSNFCGFIVKAQDLPTFWIFAYWLSPLHYAFEGIIMTQFHNDDTAVTSFTGQKVTAEKFISSYYTEWNYSHRGGDLIGLILFTVALRFVMPLVRSCFALFSCCSSIVLLCLLAYCVPLCCLIALFSFTLSLIQMGYLLSCALCAPPEPLSYFCIRQIGVIAK
jgi:hypothetical protein